jgi:hypothetical protein
MAILTSPGVSVSIIDESQYLPAPSNSIPLVLFATAQNKGNPSGTGIAAGTTAANANKLFRVTSQRDLVNLYGNPFFYRSSIGSVLQGYELNEYGLLAAYSALGATNTVYCLRADINLAELVGQTGRPIGDPDNGALWLDTSDSSWGLYVFNKTTGQFALQSPIVIKDDSFLSNGAPINTLGNVGQYAVIAIPTYETIDSQESRQYFYKAADNTWVQLGSLDWLSTVPTIQGSNSPTSLTGGNTFEIRLNGLTQVSAIITVPSSPSNTVAGIAAEINNLAWGGISASVVAGKLNIYSTQSGGTLNTPAYVSVVAGTGTVLADLGILAGIYNQPIVFWGTASQQPLWQTGQTNSRPTGSIWVKVGISGNGLYPVVNQWDSVTSNWRNKTVTLATTDVSAIAHLDATGGQAIEAGSLYAQYNDGTITPNAPVYYWKRAKTGPTVVEGTVSNPVFNNGPYTFTVTASVPGSTTVTGYIVTLGDNTDVEDFVNAWQTADIPFTEISVNESGALVITHTEGGVISITNTGLENPLTEAGFIPDSTDYVKFGQVISSTYTPNQSSTTGIGSGVEFSVSKSSRYIINSITFGNSGEDYEAGDSITISGTDLGGSSPENDLVVQVTQVGGSGEIEGVTYVSGTPAYDFNIILSNWIEADITASNTALTSAPSNGTNWFYSVVDQVDIMVKYNNTWRGYRNQNYDANGFPTPTGTNTTDPNGPIVSASEPNTQSDGTALAYGDLWIDTSDLDNYPIINRWQQIDGIDQWVRIDNTDQVSSNGIVFSDARWATDGTTDPATDSVPSIVSLLSSNYLDIDAPASSLYPTGMLLFNTRRSGYNVKEFKANYFIGANFPDQALPTEKDAWVSVSGLQYNGAPFMGRKAQRAMVVQAMKAAIDTNTSVRDEDTFFNLIATPGYPELQANMITLNADRGETAFIIGDTPLRLPESATAIQAWATNTAGAVSTGDEGLVTRSPYMGLFYPSGLTNDLSGNQVVVPASHMMIRTILRNDSIAYPWLAPAGTRRGVIDNAVSIGYLDAITGEYQPTRTRIGIRDTLYTYQINPLVFFTGNGLLNYGNKSSFDTQSALDRINVARLVAYIRRQLTIAARPFVFEPNDPLTRQQIQGVIQTLMVDLVAKRGIYDYLVVCDESNNTPARIDRNELWVDVAIEPTKAAEFIYIPVRILNTGELSASSAPINFR